MVLQSHAESKTRSSYYTNISNSSSSFCKLFSKTPSAFLSPRLPDGSLFDIKKVYPMDAVFDSPEDVPEEVSEGVRVCAYMAENCTNPCFNSVKRSRHVNNYDKHWPALISVA